MKYILVVLVLIFQIETISGQVQFIYDQARFTLDKHIHFESPVVYDALAIPDEPAEALIFKGYFNPGSYQAYRSYFIPNEMPRITQTDYDEWQQLLKQDKVYLHDCFHVSDAFNNQFLVFQYTMDNPQFLYFHSLVMKKVGSQWKHISFEKDEAASALKKIGQLRADYILEASNDVNRQIDLKVLPEEVKRVSYERFDRQLLCPRLDTVFNELQLNENERNTSKALFLNDQDGEMLSYLSSLKRIDYSYLVELINNACGFKLIKYYSSETK